jgi:hypothetical protein
VFVRAADFDQNLAAAGRALCPAPGFGLPGSGVGMRISSGLRTRRPFAAGMARRDPDALRAFKRLPIAFAVELARHAEIGGRIP